MVDFRYALSLGSYAHFGSRIALLAVLVTFNACGGGGSSLTNPSATLAPADSGEITIALTDAEGDFESYVVDVDYLRLQRANGDVVETVPLSTRIDFAELSRLAEFFTTATIPAGEYTSVVVGLNFSAAEILVQATDGTISAALAIDAAGTALTQLEVTVRLPGDEPIRIAPGVPAHVTLDFDLDASNTIDFDVSPVTVTVQPFLFVTPEFERNREHRARGVLANVNEPAAEITLKVRPFHHRAGEFGRFTFAVDDQTLYDVDGEPFSGAQGLATMAMLAENTPVVALGMVTDVGFVAQVVVAGSGVPWADVDLIEGVVLARQENSLTVRGVHIAFHDGVTVQRGIFSVLLGDDTVVATRLLDVMLGRADVSVGQHLSAAGEMRDDVTLAAERVALHINQLTARVLQPNPLVVELALLNGLRPSGFDFTGTGVAPDNDADPEHYEIDTATLPLLGVESGEAVRVRGWVNGFGLAPPDFNARTVIDVNQDRFPASLRVDWEGGTGSPFNSIEPARIDINLSEARHVLQLSGLDAGGADLNAIAVLATDDGRGAYAVVVRGADELHAYSEFAALVAELERQLAAGNVLRRIAAHGRYNAGTVELTAPRAGFEFIAP
ncbi:MAG: DUF4382 domain-containing protein [Gammaproteobacteria bacterium]|nr:MAG: DUF4382 domain-containing protein [Gammaproteobacteria bacterium]